MSIVQKLIQSETERQNNTLSLIASENYPSNDVRVALASPFTYKYAEGYPGRRYYGGCEVVDELETYTQLQARALFNAEHVNVQPHSGAQANMAAYLALLNPGDTVLSLSLKDGGHLTHGSPVNASGKLYNFVHYPVSIDAHALDYEAIEELADIHKPKLIVAGGSSTLATIDWSWLKDIADNADAFLMADIAHTAGFIAAKMLPSPVRYADVVTMTTQKTLRGPRGGIILCTNELAKRIDSAVFPGTQGGPHMNTIAAKAVMLEEASSEDFRKYMENVKTHASEFAWFMEQFILPEYIMYNPDAMPHMVMINTQGAYGITGAEAQQRLEEYGIIVNKQALPGDECSPAVGGGIRLGFAAAVTRATRGHDRYGVPIGVIGALIHAVLQKVQTPKLIRESLKPFKEFLKDTPIVG